MKNEFPLQKYYSKWDCIIDDFRRSILSVDRLEDVSEEEYVKLSAEVHQILSKLILYFTSKSGIRDQFSEPEYLHTIRGQSVNVRSEKMNTTISFGIYENTFYMGSYIDYPFYLKSMDDKFWSYVLSLNDFGTFSFQENAIPSSNQSRTICKTIGKSKSNLFKVIQNYILLESDGGSVDLGELEVTWPITVAWQEMIPSGINTFKSLHRINYLLYRRYYLNTRRR